MKPSRLEPVVDPPDCFILSGTIYQGQRYVFLTAPTKESLVLLNDVLRSFERDPELPDFNTEMADIVWSATVDQM